MEIISFEKRTFEEIAAKLDRFVQRVESLCREHGGKETGEWMDNHERWPLPKSGTGLTTVLTM